MQNKHWSSLWLTTLAKLDIIWWYLCFSRVFFQYNVVKFFLVAKIRGYGILKSVCIFYWFICVNIITFKYVILHHAQVRNDTIVEVWLPKWQKEFAKVTSLGYRTLLASTFYLNRVASPYSQDWRGYYGVDPQNFTGENRCVRFWVNWNVAC